GKGLCNHERKRIVAGRTQREIGRVVKERQQLIRRIVEQVDVRQSTYTLWHISSDRHQKVRLRKSACEVLNHWKSLHGVSTAHKQSYGGGMQSELAAACERIKPPEMIEVDRIPHDLSVISEVAPDFSLDRLRTAQPDLVPARQPLEDHGV